MNHYFDFLLIVISLIVFIAFLIEFRRDWSRLRITLFISESSLLQDSVSVQLSSNLSESLENLTSWISSITLQKSSALIILLIGRSSSIWEWEIESLLNKLTFNICILQTARQWIICPSLGHYLFYLQYFPTLYF